MADDRSAAALERLHEALEACAEEQQKQVETARKTTALLEELNEGLRKLLVTVGARPPEPPPGPRRVP